MGGGGRLVGSRVSITFDCIGNKFANKLSLNFKNSGNPIILMNTFSHIISSFSLYGIDWFEILCSCLVCTFNNIFKIHYH